MRFLGLAILVAVALSTGSGCARNKHATPRNAGPAGAATVANQSLVVTPDFSVSGKVSSVNVEGRFVVLTFTPGHVPAAQQQLNVYHRGIKAGVVKVTGQQLNENVIADVVSGQAEVGDEAREK